MKKSTKILALLMALLMCVSVLLSACDGGKDPGPDGPGGDDPDTGDKTNYSVRIKTAGGMPLGGATFYVYDEEDNVQHIGTTDKAGNATFQLATGGKYTVEVSDTLKGYDVSKAYSFNGTSAIITLSSSVITDQGAAGIVYKLGDILRDYTVTNVDGERVSFSELLKDKKGLMINFFFSSCGPCNEEMPYIQSAYEKYGADMALIAICPGYPGENNQKAESFRDLHGLTFDVAYTADQTMMDAFALAGYPTTVFVDRYGMICLVEPGGMPSEKPFQMAFEHLTAANYQQKTFTSMSELTPIEKVNVERPSSEEIRDAFEGQDLGLTYGTEEDDEYCWPFLVGTDANGDKYIYASNAEKDNSYSLLTTTVSLKKGEALAFDWYATTELGADYLYVIVNGKDICAIAGESDAWATRYAYVAEEDGEYELVLSYIKDGGTNAVLENNPYKNDTVCLRNLRVVDVSEVDNATYIPHYAATEQNEDHTGFGSYVTVVFNEKDGYYHVGEKDGPLLLANLLGSTHNSEELISFLGYNGDLIDPMTGKEIYFQEPGKIKLEDYCNYALNGELYGLCPVTEQLRYYLEIAADAVGFAEDAYNKENLWLGFCEYYNAYGTNGVEMADPIRGLATFSAFDTVVSEGGALAYNSVYYNRLIMPRGLKYKLVPEVSGVYRIRSHNVPVGQSLDAWIFSENGSIINTYMPVSRFVDEEYLKNCEMIMYFEAGVAYYIDIAFYDIYAVGGFDFTVEYLGESYERFRYAAPGFFSYEEAPDGSMGATIALGVDVMLGDDGYYYEKRADGSRGSLIYADFTLTTSVFGSTSIEKLLAAGAFDFSYSEVDQEVMATLAQCGGDRDACIEALKAEWGDAYAEYETEVNEALAGIYHGMRDKNGNLIGNKSDVIRKYMNQKLTASDGAELVGCVAVTEELAEALQLLMDKYTFSGVENSWLKLCYFYQTIDAVDHGGEDIFQFR